MFVMCSIVELLHYYINLSVKIMYLFCHNAFHKPDFFTFNETVSISIK